MKKALRTWWLYLIGFSVFLFVAAIAIGLRIGVIYWGFTLTYKPDYPSYTFLFSAIILTLIGFVWQDILRARVRHKTKNWDKKLDDETLFKAWKIFLPFLFAAILSLIMGIIFTFFKF